MIFATLELPKVQQEEYFKNMVFLLKNNPNQKD